MSKVNPILLFGMLIVYRKNTENRIDARQDIGVMFIRGP